jgi:hypothetical protein
MWQFKLDSAKKVRCNACEGYRPSKYCCGVDENWYEPGPSVTLQMLGMSYFFYELQRAGSLPPKTRAPWRGDGLKASAGGNLDGIYEGGYFDAGDHNKFQLPMAFSIARLNWIVHAFPDALQKTSFDVRPPHPITFSYILQSELDVS